MTDNNINIVVRAVDEASKTFGQIETAAGSTISSLENMRGSLANLAASAGVAGIGAKLINDATQYAVSLKNLSSITGETTENTSKMVAQFEYYGMSTETATGSLAKFGKNIATAREAMIQAQVSGKTSTDTFTKMGLSLADISKASTLEVFTQVQEKMRGMTDAAEKDRIAMELFGKSGYQMMAVLNATPEEVQAVIDKFQSMGLIMDQESVNAAVHLNRELGELKESSTRLGISIGLALVPALSEQMSAINDAVGYYSAMSDTSKKVIANTVLMGVEFGAINIVIGTLTTSLKAMGLAVNFAFGKWIILAEAIITAGAALHSYAKEEDDWIANHTYESNGTNYYVGKDGNVYTVSEGANAGVVEDPTGSGASANTGEIDEATKEDVIAQDNQKKKNEEDQKRLKQEEDYNRKAKEIADRNAELAKKIQDGIENSATKQKKAAEELARAQEQAAEAMQHNADLMKQANERVASIINSLQNQLIDMNGTQREIDDNKARNEYQNTIKSIDAAAVQLKSTALKLGSATGGGSTAQNWNEQLLSGDDAITALTAQKLHLIAAKYAELTGGQMPTVTSMHRYGDGSSWHDSGQAFDLSDNNLANSQALRQQLMEYAKTIGLNPLDEYNPENAQYGESNLHFTDNGTALSLAQTDKNPLAGLSEEVQSIIAAARTENFQDIKLAIAVAMRETGGDTVSGIHNDVTNEQSGARGMFQVMPGQDISDGNGGRIDIDKQYTELATDTLQNAMAGIAILKDKIDAAGDIWQGVSNYAGGDAAYVEQVKKNYESLSNIPQLTEISKLFVPARSEEAKGLAKNVEDEKLAKDLRDEQIRARKQQEETASLAAENMGNREDAINVSTNAKLRENEDSEDTYYKQSGDMEKAHQLYMQKRMKIIRDGEQQQRDLMKTEEDERQKTYDNELDSGTAYQKDVDEIRKRDYQQYIDYLHDQLSNYDLTTSQRIELETQAAEKVKQIRDLESKNFEGAIVQLQNTMKNMTLDAGSIVQDGWSTAVDDFTSSFDNLLTSNESGAERLRNVWINLANDIMNVMEKIILRGLIVNGIMQAFGMGGSGSLLSGYGDADIADFNANAGSLGNMNIFQGVDIGAHANGGVASGLSIVGERGIELADFQTPGRVYTNEQLSQAIGGAGGIKNIEVRIVNQTNQQVQSDTASVNWDGEKYIITTVIKAVGNDTMGLRTALKGATK